MRHSYSWRSKIVHGGTHKAKVVKEMNKKGTLSQVTQATGSVLRDAIIKILGRSRLSNRNKSKHLSCEELKKCFSISPDSAGQMLPSLWRVNHQRKMLSRAVHDQRSNPHVLQLFRQPGRMIGIMWRVKFERSTGRSKGFREVEQENWSKTRNSLSEPLGFRPGFLSYSALVVGARSHSSLGFFGGSPQLVRRLFGSRGAAGLATTAILPGSGRARALRRIPTVPVIGMPRRTAWLLARRSSSRSMSAASSSASVMASASPRSRSALSCSARDGSATARTSSQPA